MAEETPRYTVEIPNRVAKVIRRLPRSLLPRLLDALAELEQAPHAGLQLKGYEGRYFRVRVADWRIVYTIEEDRLIVVVVELAHRREVYERLERRG